MKKIIIEITKDNEVAKKTLSKYQMVFYKKAHNAFYNYIKKKMKQYIIEEQDNYILCCNEVKDSDVEKEINKLDTFLLGDYKNCELIQKEQSRMFRILSKFMKLMKNKTVLSYFNLFGVILTWRVE